jgi:hypothetical protein
MLLLDANGKRIRRAIGFYREYVRVEDSTPDGDISLVGQSQDLEVDEIFEDENTVTFDCSTTRPRIAASGAAGVGGSRERTAAPSTK